jgi:hypothetical protein
MASRSSVPVAWQRRGSALSGSGLPSSSWRAGRRPGGLSGPLALRRDWPPEGPSSSVEGARACHEPVSSSSSGHSGFFLESTFTDQSNPNLNGRRPTQTPYGVHRIATPGDEDRARLHGASPSHGQQDRTDHERHSEGHDPRGSPDGTRRS